MRRQMLEWEDWLLDQPVLIALPIITVVALGLCGLILASIIGVMCALGGCKGTDPYFYENGMRCRYDYLLVGKVVMAQKNCVELPQLTPIITRSRP